MRHRTFRPFLVLGVALGGTGSAVAFGKCVSAG